MEARLRALKTSTLSLQSLYMSRVFDQNDDNNNNTTINNNNNRIQRRNSRFFTISSQRRELSPTHTLKWPRRNRVQITCNTLSAYHVQHVVLRVIWYEGTAQLLCLTELKSHLFELYFVGSIIKPMNGVSLLYIMLEIHHSGREPSNCLPQNMYQVKTVAVWYLLVGCLTSQRHVSTSKGQICSDTCMCCHTQTEAADQTFYLTQSQYTDTRPTSPSTESTLPGTWPSHWTTNF